MAATTRWRDTVSKSITIAVESLIDDVNADDKGTCITWDNWYLKKVFEDNQTIYLNGKNVEYNYIQYAFDQTTVGSTVYVEDRVVKREGFIIVYNSGAGVNYIIDQNSSALKLLRRLLSFNGKNEIERNTFDFSNDFLIWLIYRVYNSNYNIEIAPDDKALKLDAIKGFKGDTEDLQTKVSASGETVMNIISTMSFLLESSNLNQVKIDLNCIGHQNISLVLQRGTVKVSLDDYVGIYEQEELVESKIAKLYLTIYLEILPMLFHEYKTDIGNELWNEDVYIDFMKSVGETLTEKIGNKISSLKIVHNN